MRKLLQVTRRASAESESYQQTFVYETEDASATVGTALREINQRPDLRDVDGNPATPIRWESSCLQKKCGACAMVIEGRPRVACDTRLAQFKGDTVHLAPLGKFPVVADLVTDRRVLFDNLKALEAWLESDVELPTRRSAIAYEASRCLECGCCLEACPNFSAEGAFGGMAAMVPMTRLLAEAGDEQRGRLRASYREHVYGGCGKSLACRDICPAEIEIDRLMARSNAVAVWGRRA